MKKIWGGSKKKKDSESHWRPKMDYFFGGVHNEVWSILFSINLTPIPSELKKLNDYFSFNVSFFPAPRGNRPPPPTRRNTLPSVCTGVIRVSACALSTPDPPPSCQPSPPPPRRHLGRGGKEGELSSVIPATHLLPCLHASHSSLSADLTPARPSVFLPPRPPTTTTATAMPHLPNPCRRFLSSVCPTGSLSGKSGRWFQFPRFVFFFKGVWRGG